MTPEQRFSSLYWPRPQEVVQHIKDHARACRLRADAGDAPWSRLAAFAADMTRRSMPNIAEDNDVAQFHDPIFQLVGTKDALHELLHDLIMEGV